MLALDRPLTRSYWMNVNDPGYPFMALVEHTNYMAPADYGGRHLVYLGNYRPMDDPLLRTPTTEVVAQFAPHLARINPAFSEDWVTDAWSFAAPFAQPIVPSTTAPTFPRSRRPCRACGWRACSRSTRTTAGRTTRSTWRSGW